MKCDGCRRERTDEQLSRHDSSGIRFCCDRKECHAYRTQGLFMEVAQELIDMIIDGVLLSSSCVEDDNHGCLVVWSSQAQEQIATHIRERMI